MIADRLVIAAVAAMYAFFPLYGTFTAFVPHPPTAPLVSRGVAIGIVLILIPAMIGAAAGALRRRRDRPVFGLWIALNVAVTFAGAIFGFDPTSGIGFSIVLAAMAATHYALLGHYRVPGAAQAIYGALLVSGLAASLVAVAFVVLKRPADLYAYNHGRAVGSFLNPNEFAQYLLAYLGAAVGLAMARRGTPMARFAAACSAVAALAFALTFSRWGLVAAAAGIGVYAVLARPRRGLPLAGLVITAALAVNVAFASFHHEPQDTGSRDVAWRAGIVTWLHFPLTGVGPVAFERLYPVMRAPDAPGPDTPVAFDPHDVPLSILAETGFLGLSAFAMMLVAFFSRLPRLAAHASAEGRTLALAIFAGLVAVSVHQLLNSASIGFGLWLEFTALALAAASWGFDAHAV